MIFVLPRAERSVPTVKLDEDMGRKKERKKYKPASQRAQFPIHFGRVRNVSIRSVDNEARWRG